MPPSFLFRSAETMAAVYIMKRKCSTLETMHGPALTSPTSEEETLAVIETWFGPHCKDYVVNKHTGGGSGRKGSRYEDFFLAFKAAEVAAFQVECPTASWPFLAGQQLNFVDDAVLLSDSTSEYFQLKNSCTVTWGMGEKSIVEDFSNQFVLAGALGLANPHTHLVVSDKCLYERLSRTIPNKISMHTTVGLFPYSDNGTINSLIFGNKELQQILAKIVADENASVDTMESALASILIACGEYPDGCSVESIVTYVHQKYPGYLRLFPVEDYTGMLTGPFITALARIPNLCYGLPRGYFKWSGYGTSGLFRNDCFSNEFKRFQERIVADAPATFDDFERLV